MMRGIIFDCFGVLAVDGWLPFKQKYFGDRPDQLQTITDMNRQTDAGLLPYEEFITSVADMAGVAPETFRSQLEQTVVNDELMRYIATELHPRYQIGMLSNVAGDWFEHKFPPDQRELFAAVSLSSETGFVKPDSRAYEHILGQLGIAADQAVFVDDREGNCSAAEELGMSAVPYKNFAQFKEDIAQVLTSR